MNDLLARVDKSDRERILRERFPDEDSRTAMLNALAGEAHDAHVGDATQDWEVPAHAAAALNSPPSARNDNSDIGPYRLLKKIAEGGMGAVYEAEHARSGQRVAVKLIRRDLATAQAVRRFEFELQTLAKLQHPGIARIYNAGTAQTPAGAQPYFAMELIAGNTLLEFARSRALSIRDCLELIARVADIVHYAHQHGVIHRDLKPANILVGSDGNPRVLDFGVACTVEGDAFQRTDANPPRQPVGTLPYMSPEQAAGEGRSVDTRSDVYSLGVILFEMLTGRLPYDVLNRPEDEVVKTICTTNAARPAQIRSALRGDIERILIKTLNKNPDQRYASANALAADIRRFLNREPIAARPHTTGYQLLRFVQRHRLLTASVMAVTFSLVAGFLVAVWKYQEARAERDAAEKATVESRHRQRIAELAMKQASIARDQATRIKDILRAFLVIVDPGVKPGDPAALAFPSLVIQNETLVSGLDPESQIEVREMLANAYAANGVSQKSRAEADVIVALAEELHGRPSQALAEKIALRGRISLRVGDSSGAAQDFAAAAAMYDALSPAFANEILLLVQQARSMDADGDFFDSFGDSAWTAIQGVLADSAAEPVMRAAALFTYAHWLLESGDDDKLAPELLAEAASLFELGISPTDAQYGYHRADQAAACNYLGVRAFNANDPHAAVYYFESALVATDAIYGDGSSESIAIMKWLESSYAKAGRDDAAQSINERRRAFSSPTERLHDNAQNAWRAGRASESIAAFEKIIQEHRRSKPANSLELCRALSDLGYQLIDTNPVRAAEYLGESLKISRERRGTSHSETIGTCHNLAKALRDSRDFDGFEQVVREGLEDANTNECYSERLLLLIDYAIYLQSINQLTPDNAILGELKTARSMMVARHLPYLTGRFREFAAALDSEGRSDEATQIATVLLRVPADLPGISARECIDSLLIVTNPRTGLGKIRPAAAIDAIDALLPKLPEADITPQSRASLLMNRGSLLRALHREAEAISDFERALALRENLDPPAPRDVMWTHYYIGYAAGDCGRYARAADAFLSGINIERQLAAAEGLAPRYEFLENARGFYAGVLIALRDADRLIAFYHNEIEIQRARGAVGRRDLARMQLESGRMLTRLDRYVEAERAFGDSLATFDLVVGRTDSDRLRALVALAGAHHKTGHTSEASLELASALGDLKSAPESLADCRLAILELAVAICDSDEERRAERQDWQNAMEKFRTSGVFEPPAWTNRRPGDWTRED